MASRRCIYDVKIIFFTFHKVSDFLQSHYFIKSGDIVQLGVPPVRIDMMTSVTGLDFATAWENRVTGSYGDIPAFFVSKADLIRNKMAVGRKQDLSDIDRLQKI